MIFENKKQKDKKKYMLFLSKIFYILNNYEIDEDTVIIGYVLWLNINWDFIYYNRLCCFYNVETNINFKELWYLMNKYEKINKRYRLEKVKLELAKWASTQYKGDLTPEEKENFFYESLCLDFLSLEGCLEFIKELEELDINYKSGVDIDKIYEDIKSIVLKNKCIFDILHIIYYFKSENFSWPKNKKMRLFNIFTHFFRFMNNFWVYKKLILYKNIKKILKKVKDI